MRRLAALLATAVTLGLMPAGAAATGTLSFGAPCFFTGAKVSLMGFGWTPSTSIAYSGPGTGFASDTDAHGELTGSFTAPPFPDPDAPEVRRITITATDTRDRSQKATGTFFDVQPGVEANLNGQSTTPVQWTIAGFTGGKTVYGHWVFKHHDRKTVRMGTVPGACGEVKHKVARIPVPSKVGTWTAQFDTSKAYRASSPNVAVQIRVLPG